MHTIVRFFILFISCTVSFSVLAQVDDQKIKPNTTDSIAVQEKKRVRDAFEILDGQESPKVVPIAHNLLKTVKTAYAKSSAHLILAYYYKNQALIDSSTFYVHKSLKIKIANNDSLNTRRNILAYNILAINYKNKGLIEESRKWHQKGIVETKKYNEVDLYYMHLHGLALCYSELENYEQALKLFEECLNHKENQEIIYGSYINISSIYANFKKFEISNKYLLKARKLAEEDKSYYALAVINLNLGDNYQEVKDHKKAITHYQKAAEISKKYNFPHTTIITMTKIGKMLIITGRYQDAELILSESLYKAKEKGLLSSQIDLYKNLKYLAEQNGDYKNALHFTTEYFTLKDSLNTLQKDKEILKFEVKFQTLTKEKEIKLLQAENSNRILELKNKEENLKNLKLQQKIKNKENENSILEIKSISEKLENENIILKKDSELKQLQALKQKSIKNILIYSFLIIMIPVIALLVIYYQKLRAQKELAKKQKEISEQKISSLVMDQELKMIKGSIGIKDQERKRIAQELHDSIGGNLASIKLQLNNSVYHKNNEFLTLINDQIDDTYNQVRDISHNLIPKTFTNNNFCDVLEDYLKNIGNASNLNILFISHPRQKIDLLRENIRLEVFKIVQELITNTIKHAKAKSIELQLNLVKTELNILFEDDGVGFDTEKITEGLGFRSIKNRLKSISGKLHIDSVIDRGTIINIAIPTTKF